MRDLLGILIALALTLVLFNFGRLIYCLFARKTSFVKVFNIIAGYVLATYAVLIYIRPSFIIGAMMIIVSMIPLSFYLIISD